MSAAEPTGPSLDEIVRLPLRKRLQHPLCVVGGAITIIGFVASTVMLSVELTQEYVDPYRGIFTFLLFPSILFLGLVAVVLGLVLEARRRRRLLRQHGDWSPALDLSRKLDRRFVMATGAFTVVFLVASVLGGMRAYEFTESVNFCGETCHEVMGPQFTAYTDSPHAGVTCAECHVGPGIENYIEAKVSGLRQVYKVLTDTVDRPIVAPHDKILPVSQTCHRCHWPEMLWGVRTDRHVRYGYDARNTRRPVQLLVNVGQAGERGRGIHWHADPENAVRFRALDEQKQTIVWVETRRSDGQTVVFRHVDHKLGEADLQSLEVHSMDCLDCHNRPAHRFLTPDRAVDGALERGQIDASLPFIKKIAVQALSRTHLSREAGLQGIREEIEGFYREHFDESVLARKEAFDRTIAAVEAIYRRHIFPEMKVNAYTHPDNIGHREFPGCFRCHDGKHETDDGERLESRCDLCHTFVRKAPGSQSLTEIPANGSSFHPWRTLENHNIECWRCHTGAGSPYTECRSCHEKIAERHNMRFECSICHKPGGEKITSERCAPCHPSPESPMHSHKDHRDCIVCHQPHNWRVENKVELCVGCHKEMMATHYPGEPCAPCHGFKGVQTSMLGLPFKNGEKR